MTASSPTTTTSNGEGKKAVHVKWAGKTIALGTFPAAEAREKCDRAKALTKGWRSTMRPKPTRDWVIGELERLGVRVVSGRLGNKHHMKENNDSLEKQSNKNNKSVDSSSVTTPSPFLIERSNSITSDLDGLLQRRCNTAMSTFNDDLSRRGSLGSLGPLDSLMMMDDNDSVLESFSSPRRSSSIGYYPRRSSSIGFGTSSNDTAAPPTSVPLIRSQHYEMLKLHRMNLLQEIQETTLMMNLYEQQQLCHLQQHQNNNNNNNAESLQPPQTTSGGTDDDVNNESSTKNKTNKKQQESNGASSSSLPAEQQNDNKKKQENKKEEKKVDILKKEEEQQVKENNNTTRQKDNNKNDDQVKDTTTKQNYPKQSTPATTTTPEQQKRKLLQEEESKAPKRAKLEDI